ncbi:hypothetical protein Tsubulata_034277 [Turnera subulata]|uniref:FHA domain-containing protein n=1 Tax=Turnera subulata TaxID=218843 RepID=A0A9Q0F7A9_9ROSI|nr:hypothetical protein Tsubulata_034277 [Turnera subulata]
MATNAEEKNPEKEEQERMIPVFTVLKNGAILKNIFVINNPPSPSPAEDAKKNPAEQENVEESLVVGRHPECNILLMHPSISRFHLRIDTKPYSRKLFVTDLSSVHGTWVSGKRIEPGSSVELNEGDTIKLGGSTRVYKLHWVPLSRAYDVDNPFISETDLEVIREKEDENADLEDASEMQKCQDMNCISVGNGKPQSDLTLEQNVFLFVDENCGSILQQGIPSGNSVPEDVNESLASEVIEGPSTNDHDVREISSAKTEMCGILKKKNTKFNEYSPSLGCIMEAAEVEDIEHHIAKVEPASNVSDELILSEPSLPDSINPFLKSEEVINPFLKSEEVMNLSTNDYDVRETSSPSTDISGIFESKNLQISGDNLSSESHYVMGAVETENLENPVPKIEPESHASANLDSLLSFPAALSDINSQEVKGSQLSDALAALKPEYGLGDLENLTDALVSHKSIISDDLAAPDVCEEAAEAENIEDPEAKAEPQSNASDDLNSSLPLPGNLSNISNQQVLEKQTLDASTSLLPVYEEGNLVDFKDALISHKSVCSDDLSATEIYGELANQIPEPPIALQPVCEEGNLEIFMQTADITANGICELINQNLAKNNCYENQSVNVLSVPLVSEPLNSSFPVRDALHKVTESQESQTPQSVFGAVENLENIRSSDITSEKKLGSSNIWSRRGKPDASLQLLKTRGTASDAGVEWENQVGIEGGLIEKDIVPGLEAMGGVLSPGKENLTPNTLLLKSLKMNYKLSASKIAFSPNIQVREHTVVSSDKENHVPKNLPKKTIANQTSTDQVKLEEQMVLNERRAERIPLQSLFVNQSGMRIFDTSSALNNISRSSNPDKCLETVQRINSFEDGRKRWIMVADTNSLLDKESRKSLQLLQGLKRTCLVIPDMVIRELDCLKRRGSLFRRKTEASLALEWIEECMVKTKWWLHVQSSVTDGRQTTPTPRGAPQSQFFSGSQGSPFGTNSVPSSACGNIMDIATPTAEDHILASAVHCRRMQNDGQLVLLSNDVTLTIKAMAEGLLCETARDFRNSLVNPFSERFMWADSSPRGHTWSVSDDVVLKETFYRSPATNSSNAKGLKLILHHNSH